ncbi:Sugar transporter ERD6 [Melia azedarach]|uniref:Sugar transporter ERD6 n=1 Tax=Melia azedarach TaxID=155640 RepID=A0ACC1Y8P0_MELAZ|nr:Sugar transporter ERD6 [Melia azedarach]
MAAKKDIETGNSNSSEPRNGNGELNAPLIDRKNAAAERKCPNKDDGLCVVLLSTLIAVCGSFEFGSCVGYSSPAQFGMMADLKESYSEFSIFGSILTIGAIIGAITSGRIADWVGRKGAMRIASIICIAGWLAVSLSSAIPLLDFGRFLTGCGIGVISYVVPVYIAEITPKELRGALATANQLFIVVGTLVSFVAGALVSWRTLALIGIAPCLVMLVGLFFIPESPRWLAMVGQNDKFEVALSQLRGANADISQEQIDILESLALLNQLPKVGILDLFNKRNIRFVIVGVGLMVFQQAIGINGYIYYAGQIFVSAGVSPSLGSILYASLQVVLTAFGASLMDKAGRRPLLMISVVGLFLGNLLTGLSFLLKQYHMAPDAVPVLAVTGVLIYIGFFSFGMGPIPWVIMSEIFPLNIKGTGGSLVTLVNWIGSWVISYSFIFLMNWSSYGVFFLYGAFCAVSMIFTIKYVPETKGRTLEEIQASMN